jgi:hypothetical protein
MMMIRIALRPALAFLATLVCLDPALARQQHPNNTRGSRLVVPQHAGNVRANMAHANMTHASMNQGNAPAMQQMHQQMQANQQAMMMQQQVVSSQVSRHNRMQKQLQIQAARLNRSGTGSNSLNSATTNSLGTAATSSTKTTTAATTPSATTAGTSTSTTPSSTPAVAATTTAASGTGNVSATPGVPGRTGVNRGGTGAVRTGMAGLYASNFGQAPNIQGAQTLVLQLNNAYSTLANADHDYQGHRVRAMNHIHGALRNLGMSATTLNEMGIGQNAGVGLAGAASNAGGAGRLPQAQSDSALRQAIGYLRNAQMHVNNGGLGGAGAMAMTGPASVRGGGMAAQWGTQLINQNVHGSIVMAVRELEVALNIR